MDAAVMEEAFRMACGAVRALRIVFLGCMRSLKMSTCESRLGVTYYTTHVSDSRRGVAFGLATASVARGGLQRLVQEQLSDALPLLRPGLPSLPIGFWRT